MKKTPIPPFSKKRLARLARDAEVITIICRRAGGTPFESAYYQGSLIGVACLGGRCESCGGKPTSPTWRLHNHELEFKSRGGVVSETNSIMVCDDCHGIEGHNIKIVHSEPMWIKEVTRV